MSGSCRGQETREGFGIWRGKGLEVHTTHDPVLHMMKVMWVAHEHNWLPSTHSSLKSDQDTQVQHRSPAMAAR
jgi:hypothetical protein